MGGILFNCHMLRSDGFCWVPVDGLPYAVGIEIRRVGGRAGVQSEQRRI